MASSVCRTSGFLFWLGAMPHKRRLLKLPAVVKSGLSLTQLRRQSEEFWESIQVTESATRKPSRRPILTPFRAKIPSTFHFNTIIRARSTQAMISKRTSHSQNPNPFDCFGEWVCRMTPPSIKRDPLKTRAHTHTHTHTPKISILVLWPKQINIIPQNRSRWLTCSFPSLLYYDHSFPVDDFKELFRLVCERKFCRE
jgi:hypothetical protein